MKGLLAELEEILLAQGAEALKVEELEEARGVMSSAVFFFICEDHMPCHLNVRGSVPVGEPPGWVSAI